MSEVKRINYRVINVNEVARGATQYVSFEHESNETDDEIIERLRERFQILEDMTRAVKQGHVRAMIVSGAAGVGKSWGVENVLADYQLIADIANNEKLRQFEVVKGKISALGLYAKLYQYRDPKNVIVFDDIDDVLMEESCLNILKAAVNTSGSCTVHWNTDSRKLDREDIPNSFDFRGGLIFITNINLADVRSKRTASHIRALESRCHTIDLTIHTQREILLRIRQLIKDGMLDNYGFAQETVDEIVNFIEDNKGQAEVLDLRTVIKLADLCRAFPDRWKAMANVTLLKG